MKFSVQLPIHWHTDPGAFLDGHTLAALARDIEQAGFDACFVTEHPAPSRDWLDSGGHHTLDPFVALSFAAAGTTRLRLHTNLLVLSYRNPLLTAKAVASLDLLSCGRVVCGVGVGYMESEFRALGADFGARGRRTDEALRVMKAAWSGEPLDYDGEGFSARANVVQPRPAQRPHPPLWVGGNSDHAIRRAVAFGDGWMPFPTRRSGVTTAIADIDGLRERIGFARAAAADAGRERALDICMVPFGWAMTGADAAPDTAALREQLRELQALGVTWAVLALEGACAQDYRDRLRQLAREVLQPLA